MNLGNLFKKKKNKIYNKDEKSLSGDRKMWRTIVLVFVFINICTISFSWYLFLQISGGDIFSVKQDNAISIKTVSRKLLSDTTTSFEKKVDDFNKLNNTDRSNVIDPSL